MAGLHPNLFSFGPLTLHAYGTALALSFFMGVLLARARAPRRGIAKSTVMDLFQLIVLSAIVGSRFFFVIFHLDAYRGRWLHMFAVWEGGLTLYGGLLLAIFTSFWYLRRKGIPFLQMADVMAPSLGLGLLITRLGCFLNGCCYGLPTDSALGVHFPAGCEASRSARETLATHLHGEALLDLPQSPAIHAAQLYASLGGLIILLLLLWLDRRRRPDGSIFAAFLVLYGILRFTVDQFRYYEEAMRIFALSVNQWLSLALIVAGVLLWRRLQRQPRAS